MSKISTAQIRQLRESIDVLVRVFKITDAVSVDGAGKLNPPDAQTIIFISKHPKCTATDVGALLGVVPTTTSAIIDRLVRKGLVRRQRTSENRRIVQLSLTKDGEAVCKSILAEQNAHCRVMLKALDPGERETFLNAMDQIVKKII